MNNLIYAGLAISIFLSGCSKSSQPNQKVTDDFVVTIGDESTKPEVPILQNPSDLNLCRQRIAQLVCLVNPSQSGGADRSRTCLVGSEKYASHFEGHFDRSPDFVRKMYCYLDRIWIEKGFIGTAYADPLTTSKGKILAGGIGIRREVLESALPFDPHHQIDAAVEALAKGTEAFAAERMNRSIRLALAGRRVEDV